MRPDPETSAAEAGLIQAAVHGDQAAWEALMRVHQEPLFRFAYLMCGDPDEADDIAQEAFIRAYRALERFDLSRPLRPWLLSIAANLARNRFRSLGRRLNALRSLGQSRPAQAERVEETGERRWQAQRLRQAVERLGEKDRQIIYLRYFLELSTEEVAAAAGIPAGTVKSRLHRAIGRLRQVIEEGFPGLQDGWEQR
jgi:RNA polymerase sigma-70 factor (ECF subfamily)